MVRMVLKNYLASLGHTEDDHFYEKTRFSEKFTSTQK